MVATSEMSYSQCWFYSIKSIQIANEAIKISEGQPNQRTQRIIKDS